MPLFARLRKAVYDRRRGLGILAGLAVGTYLLAQYASSKLAEFQDESQRERTAKENLRRRFYQNLEDCTFTVLALLPTLEEQLAEEYDVVGLTEELQRRTKGTGSSPASSGTLPSQPPSEAGQSTTTAESSQVSSPKSSALDESLLSAPSTIDSIASLPNSSVASSSSAPSDGGGVGAPPSEADSAEQHPAGTLQPSRWESKSKLELWTELKHLTFTRTLTAAYALPLLTLLTHMQLALLGRHSYLSCVRALARARAPVPFEPSSESRAAELSVETERAYLSFSWWALHRGWRVVGARVERAVREVLGPVGIKALVGEGEIEGWLEEIRRRVEREEDGSEFDFLPALFPPTPEDERAVLHASGLSSPTPTSPPPLSTSLLTFPPLPSTSTSTAAPSPSPSSTLAQLSPLLSETRAILRSSDFALVRRAALDTIFALLRAALVRECLPSHGERIVLVEQERVRLASVLPGVKRTGAMVLGGVPNEFVEAVAAVEELVGLSAVVYSNFGEHAKVP